MSEKMLLVEKVADAIAGAYNRKIDDFYDEARAAIEICRADPSFDLRLTEDEAEELVKREWISGGGDMDKITAGQAFYCIEKHGAFRPDPDPPVPEYSEDEVRELYAILYPNDKPNLPFLNERVKSVMRIRAIQEQPQ